MSIFSDTRSMKELQKITYSGYKKTDVIKQLIQAIQDKNIEPALNWCGELLCAGHLLELWNTLISCAMVHINVCNPRLPVYLIRRYDDFREIIKLRLFYLFHSLTMNVRLFYNYCLIISL